MPTYEYNCKSCGLRFEEFQSIADEPIKICPQCNKESVQRVVSGGAGLIFRGSGFYITDYARKEKTDGSSGDQKKSESNGARESSSDADSNTGTEKSSKSQEN